MRGQDPALARFIASALSLALCACGGGNDGVDGAGGAAGTGGTGTGGSAGAAGAGGTPQPAACAEIEAKLPPALVPAAAHGALVSLETDAVSCRAAAGTAIVTSATRADAAMAYLIGSSTKTFVAAAILALDREGLIPDDKNTVEAWLPGLVPNGANITIGHLLTHTSGLPNYTYVVEQDGLDTTKVATPEALVQLALTLPPNFAPGAEFRYCNTGYILLGMIIEKAAGAPWGEVVRERFLIPLQLQHTYIDYLELQAGTPLLHSYATVSGTEFDGTTYAHPSWAGAAGSMLSTLDDMTRWTKALYGGEVFDGKYLDALLEPQVVISAESKLYYSVGTIIHDTPFGRWVGHGGTFAGTLSYMGSIPEKNIFVQGAVNHQSADRFVIADVAWAAELGAGLGDLAPLVDN